MLLKSERNVRAEERRRVNGIIEDYLGPWVISYPFLAHPFYAALSEINKNDVKPSKENSILDEKEPTPKEVTENSSKTSIDGISFIKEKMKVVEMLFLGNGGLFILLLTMIGDNRAHYWLTELLIELSVGLSLLGAMAAIGSAKNLSENTHDRYISFRDWSYWFGIVGVTIVLYLFMHSRLP